MQYYRCQCGKSEMWGSMNPDPCDGCEECSTSLAQGPHGHKKPEPHHMVPTKVETDEGDKVLSRCQWCHKTKKQLGIG